MRLQSLLEHKNPFKIKKKKVRTELRAMEQMSLLRLTSAGLSFLSRFVLKMWSGLAVGNLM